VILGRDRAPGGQVTTGLAMNQLLTKLVLLLMMVATGCLAAGCGGGIRFVVLEPSQFHLLAAR
jgi:hypothetical protein